MLQMWADGKPEDQNIKASVGMEGTENLVSEAKDVLWRLPILPYSVFFFLEQFGSQQSWEDSTNSHYFLKNCYLILQRTDL